MSQTTVSNVMPRRQTVHLASSAISCVMLMMKITTTFIFALFAVLPLFTLSSLAQTDDHRTKPLSDILSEAYEAERNGDFEVLESGEYDEKVLSRECWCNRSTGTIDCDLNHIYRLAELQNRKVQIKKWDGDDILFGSQSDHITRCAKTTSFHLNNSSFTLIKRKSDGKSVLEFQMANLEFWERPSSGPNPLFVVRLLNENNQLVAEEIDLFRIPDTNCVKLNVVKDPIAITEDEFNKTKKIHIGWKYGYWSKC